MLILARSLQPRQNLLQAAGLVGQTSGELLQQIGESDTDPRFQVSAAEDSHSLKPSAFAQDLAPGAVTLLREGTGRCPSLSLEPQ